MFNNICFPIWPCNREVKTFNISETLFVKPIKRIFSLFVS